MISRRFLAVSVQVAPVSNFYEVEDLSLIVLDEEHMYKHYLPALSILNTLIIKLRERCYHRNDVDVYLHVGRKGPNDLEVFCRSVTYPRSQTFPLFSF